MRIPICLSQERVLRVNEYLSDSAAATLSCAARIAWSAAVTHGETKKVRRLVKLCQREMGAIEVWFFGSRARGDHRENTDYDLTAVIPDDAPADVDTPVAAFRLRRQAGAHADLFTVRQSDYLAARSTPNTLSEAFMGNGSF